MKHLLAISDRNLVITILIVIIVQIRIWIPDSLQVSGAVGHY